MVELNILISYITSFEISTSHMVIDPLTKLIPRDVFKAYVRELGLYKFWSLYQ